MIKPLIPIIFLALWVILFEDKIWPDWENEAPVKIFSKGELQWEFDMDSDLAEDNYRFEFIQLSGTAYKAIDDTLIIDKTVYCKMESLNNTLLNQFFGKSIKLFSSICFLVIIVVGETLSDIAFEFGIVFLIVTQGTPSWFSHSHFIMSSATPRSFMFTISA